MLVVLSFFSGLALGLLNFFMLERSLKSHFQRSIDAPFRRLALTAGAFRHVFIFLAGICLLQGAHLAPVPLCGGLLASVVVTFLRVIPQRNVGKEITWNAS